MSTKIYHAYVYDGPIEDLFAWLLAFRKRHVAATLKRMRAVFTPEADFHEVAELLRAATAHGLNTDLNLAASAVVYPHGNSVLVQFFGADDALLRRLGPKFKDYHYQNATDRPDGVTAREWTNRRRVWDAIIDRGDGTFAGSGLVFQLVPKHFEFDVARHVCRPPKD